MYPSRRQSPGSGVGLDRGAGGGFTATEAAMPTKVGGRGAAVPVGVDRTRAGVAEGSTVGDAVAVGVVATFGDEVRATTPPTMSTATTTAAPVWTRGSSARRRVSGESMTNSASGRR